MPERVFARRFYVVPCPCAEYVQLAKGESKALDVCEEQVDFLAYFADPKPWDCKAYASFLPLPTWHDHATCGLVTFDFAVHGLADMEEEASNQDFDDLVAVFPFAQSFFSFVDNRILGKDLDSRVRTCFSRALPKTPTETAYKEFFNHTKRNNNMAQQGSQATFMNDTASDVLEYFMAADDFKNMTGAYSAAAGFASHFLVTQEQCDGLKGMQADLLASKEKMNKEKKDKEKKPKKSDHLLVEEDEDDDDDADEDGADTIKKKKKSASLALGELGDDIKTVKTAVVDVHTVLSSHGRDMKAVLTNTTTIAASLTALQDKINADADAGVDVAELTAESVKKDAKLALLAFVQTAIGQVFEDEDEGGLDDETKKKVKTILRPIIKSAVIQAKDHFDWSKAEVLAFLSPLNLNLDIAVEKIFAA